MTESRFTTPALILRRYSLGETDRLLVLYTPERGLLRAGARGARRSKKRFGGILDLLYFLEVDLQKRKSDIHILENARLADPYRPLSEDLMLYATGCHLAEVATIFASEHHTDPAAFAVLTAGLDALCRGLEPGAVSRAVELHTLAAAGLTPRLANCGRTNRALREDEPTAFEPRHGGAVGRAVASAEAQPLSASARRRMAETLALPPEKAFSLVWEKEDLLAARAANIAMITYHAGRGLRVRSFAESATRYFRDHAVARRVEPEPLGRGQA
jgi:DNA repair protein RecO (recombination protein O)